MLRNERRVVITGLGLVTPLGIGIASVWDALIQRRGAIAKLQAFPVDGLPNDLGAEVAGLDKKAMIELALPRVKKQLRKSLNFMARDIQLSVACAQLAYLDAGLEGSGIDPTRIGVDLGAGLISTELEELAPAIDAGYGSGQDFDYDLYARDGIEKDHADLVAQVFAQHAGVSYLDSPRLPGAEQHYHRGRGRFERRHR